MLQHRPRHSVAATERPRHLETLVLGDGAEIRIRPLAPRDRAGVAALFSRLSAQSRYRRFHVPKRELSDSELAFFTDVDHVRHEALAAVNTRDNSIVGVARYVQYADRPRVAAVAFEVADEWQRKGIGAALAQRLLDRARVNGLDRLTATTRWENPAARALLRRLGFRARATGGASGEIEFELALDSLSLRRRSGGPDRNRLRGPGSVTRALGPRAVMLVVAVLLILPASAAAARTIKVTDTRDSGPGSLRSALGKAHDGDTILAPRDARAPARQSRDRCGQRHGMPVCRPARGLPPTRTPLRHRRLRAQALSRASGSLRQAH